MKGKKDVTIYDIANELNLSPSTVSRALKDHGSIGKETIKAVKKLASERGYFPNTVAASLRGKSNTIGVMMSWINRPFISSLISGIEEYATTNGQNVIISQSRDSYESEVASTRALYGSRVGGLIVSLAMQTRNYDHFQRFIRDGIPVVFVDRVTEEFDADRVVIDNFAAGFSATQHLIDQGCRRIAHFVGAEHRNIYRDRHRGYLEALRQNNLPIDQELIVHVETMSSEEGIRGTQYLMSLPSPPDGLFSSNDTAAVSAIQYAKKTGVSIPHDLAIIGFNNDPISLIIDPPLSTVSHPAVEMGRIAAMQIMRHKDERDNKKKDSRDIVKSETIVLKTELIIRESSLKKLR